MGNGEYLPRKSYDDFLAGLPEDERVLAAGFKAWMEHVAWPFLLNQCIHPIRYKMMLLDAARDLPKKEAAEVKIRANMMIAWLGPFFLRNGTSNVAPPAN